MSRSVGCDIASGLLGDHPTPTPLPLRVAVAGADHAFGRMVASHLRSRIGWRNVTTLTFAPDRSMAIAEPSIEADCSTPRRLGAALAGADRLVIVTRRDPRGDEERLGGLLDAASRAGVGRIVLTSLLSAEASTMPGAPAHLRLEALVARAAAPAVVLRIGAIAEDHLRHLDGAFASGVLPSGVGEATFSPASIADYAFAAASVATADGQHDGLVHDLAGDRP